MIEITVKRLPGDKSGGQISDRLITSIPVAMAKGRAEINRSSPANRKTLNISTVLLPRKMPGLMVAITTSNHGRRVGRLNLFERVYQTSGGNFSWECNLAVEVIDDKQ